MTDVRLTTIDFHGATLIAQPGDDPAKTHVAMKPVVEGMGLDWKSQHTKLREHAVLAPTMVEITIVADDGRLRAMTALPLNRLGFWLATIHPNKVTDPKVRERVVAYQNECADALFNHFFGKQVATPPVPVAIAAQLSKKPYEEWTLEEKRTALSVVNTARHVLNQACAAWHWQAEGFPMPPRHLMPAWWQSDMTFNPEGDRRSITILMPGGRA